MSETYPRKNLCETLFAGQTPSSVEIGCKVTIKFADVQENSDFFVIFSLEDAPRRYCLGLETTQRSQKCARSA